MTFAMRGFAIVSWFIASAGQAQSETAPIRVDIIGSVTNVGGAAAIDGVEITLVGTNRSARSDERGRFAIIGVSPGAYMLVARKPGFSPESLSVSLADTAAHVHFVLRATAVQTLDKVMVKATPSVSPRHEGFERRRKGRSGGRFITREDIERRGSKNVSDVLRGIQGIRMIDSAGVTLAISSRSPKVNLLSRQVVVNCVVRVGVDGVLKESGFPVDILVPKDIHGIEIYAGASTVPPEFNSSRNDAYCGLIMIWTRAY